MAAPHFYVAVAGNSFSVIDVVHQLVPATRAIAGSGNAGYGGVTSDLGLLSRDAAAVYLSIVNGLGAATATMGLVAPYTLSGGVANSGLLAASVFNPYSARRAYMGNGTFCDLRGLASSSVNLAAYITGAQYLSARMLYRTGTNHVFVGNCGSDGVVRINTLTGAVDDVAGVGAYLRALYYSADTDTLYVDSSPDLGTPGTVTSYDGETLAVGATFASAGVADGLRHGHSIHLGGELFAASEATTAYGGRLWLVDLSSAPGSVSEFGSGTTLARDPVTGYIWTPWRTGGGVTVPEGGVASLDGTYALVYDPSTETLIDAVRLGDSSADFMSILYSGDGTGDGGADGGAEGTPGGGGAGAAAVFPASLPGPSVIRIAAVEHRAKPGDTNGPFETRALQLDRLYDEYCEFVFSLAECEAFVTWWTDTLIEGGLRFTSGWQTPQGTALSRQFIGAPRFMGHDSQGGWRMACNFQVFGRMEPPRNYGAAPAPAPPPAPLP